ncbi:MAG TPA: glycosyltransferase [Halomonas sp.]|nr:glycosyltransferase [Halomonas sp.]
MISKPKILFLIDHLDTGGAPVVLRNLVYGLYELGAEISLIVLSNRVSHSLPDNVNLTLLPFSPQNRVERFFRYRKHAHLLDEWVLAHRMNNADLVISHLHYAHQVTSRSLLAEKAWYCIHSDPVLELTGKKIGLDKFVKRRKISRLYRQRKVIGVSQGILDSLCDGLGIAISHAKAIHNPIDTDRIHEKAHQPVHDVPARYLLFVGRLDQRAKRFDRLLRSYKKSGVELPLVIVGDGPAQEEIERYIHEMELTERVNLVGHRDNPYPYMKGAQAVLLSSDYEGFSLVLAESLACGTPVVSTDCPSGPREILTGDHANFLVPLNNDTAFANAILNVVSEPPNITKDSMQRFSFHNTLKLYLALIEID